ncbi:LIS motif containing protein [Parasponia andersonii]|uniref:LIS motif containing protein n=1 Tax=Parasponia andersonii TaxID=3476 RepID=A0A2P5BT98_PARAD|nr:LIS motif containing protein [Parasponia andersonii]
MPKLVPKRITETPAVTIRYRSDTTIHHLLHFRLRWRSVMDVDPRHYDHVVINDTDIHNIIISYLVHNCYEETAESFIGCTGMKQPADYIEDMEKRKRIINFALEGNALEAIELTEQFAHDLLEKNNELHFDLLSLHFVNLVCSRKCTEALEFAQTKLTPFEKMEKYVSKIEDILALLAYDEPEKSPVFHYLSPEYRQQVADSLNRAILAHANLPSYTAMERLIKQTTIVRQCLSQDTGKDGLPPFSLKDFLRS